MPLPRFVTARPFVTLGFIVAAWLVIPVGIKTFTRASFFEMTAPVTVMASYAASVQEWWTLRLHSRQELIQAGTDVARLNSSYEVAVQQNRGLEAEVARLEDLLHMPPYDNFRFEYARVARSDFSGWWQSIVIRKGQNYGIPVGAPVIFSGGVVGRVSEVHLMTAVVELISSPNVRLAAVAEGDNRPFSFQGGINTTIGPPRGVVEFVPLDVVANAAAPRRLVTSALGVFPPNLVIGTITRLEIGSDGLFKNGEVQLDERLGSLTEVTVLVPTNPQ